MIRHEKIRQKRKEKGLTLRELSSTTSIALSYLSDIERGKAIPSVPVLSAIANALECSLDDLVGTENPTPPVRRRQKR
jgi:transcriptional regulator with XRE-family HTH domain